MEINKLFKWFYTAENGHEYMTFAECSLQDKALIISTVSLCIAVISIYLAIAYDAYNKGRGYKFSNTRKYLQSLMLVFITCAITGYGYIILSVWINPYWLRVILLSILVYQAFKMYQSQKLNTSIEDTYKKEQELHEKYQKQLSKKTQIIDLFTDLAKKGHNGVNHIPFESLDEVPEGQEFDSDGSGVIFNTRINIEVPGFTAKSRMKANSEVPPHSHDTDKILKCTKGAFYDSFTRKWYKEGEFLFIPAAINENEATWHDITTGEEETELLTYIMPKV